MVLKYILQNKVPVIERDLLTWAQWMEDARESGESRVGFDVVRRVEISTVFLGIDHQFFPGGPPILFETMVFEELAEPIVHDLKIFDRQRKWTQFKEEIGDFTRRYSTWEQAEAGHNDAVAGVRRLFLRLVNGGG